MSDERRVVLIKPGDVLLIGNLGRLEVDPERMTAAGALFREWGILPVFFSEDISIDHEDLKALRELGKVER